MQINPAKEAETGCPWQSLASALSSALKAKKSVIAATLTSFTMAQQVASDHW